MSLIYDGYRASTTEDTWYVKAPGGDAYGPVTMGELHQWARDGRLAAGCLVSKRRDRWDDARPVEALDLPALPITQAVADEAPDQQSDRRDAIARADALATEASALKARISTILGEKDDAIRSSASLETALEEARELNATLDHKLKAVLHQVDGLKAEKDAQPDAADVRRLQDTISHEHRQLEQLKEDSTKREAILSARIRDLEADNASAWEELETMQTANEALTALAEKVPPLEQAVADGAEVQRDNARLKAALQGSETSVETLEQKLEARRAKAATRKQVAEARIEELRQKVSEARQKTAQADAAAAAKLKARIEMLQGNAEHTTDIMEAAHRELQKLKTELLTRLTRDEQSKLEAKLDAFQASRGQDKLWFMQTPEGDTYGPSTLSELQTWAVDCRVDPSFTVSFDRKTWTPAHKVPELRMNWTARLLDGSDYGPISLLAIPHLMEDGTISRESEVRNTVTDQAVPVERLLAPEFAELMSENDRLVEQLRRQE